VQSSVKRIRLFLDLNVGFALIGIVAGRELGLVGADPMTSVIATSASSGASSPCGAAARRSTRCRTSTVSSASLVLRQLCRADLLCGGHSAGGGFWGKFEVFEAGLRTDLLWLVLVGALSSVCLGISPQSGRDETTGEPLDRTDYRFRWR
jgi:NADH:ubiquinone oxidoreductase subunit 2 (subunit N)